MIKRFFNWLKSIFTFPEESEPKLQTTTSDGLNLIRIHEGLRLDSYRCPAGKWTIGYGHTKDVESGMSIGFEEAENLLFQDVREAERAVRAMVTVPLNDNQFSALVSFVFNLGATNFANSTLKRLLNEGNYELAALQFGRWVYAGPTGEKKRLPGLVKRRLEEQKLFETKI
jgi:lysozyme